MREADDGVTVEAIKATQHFLMFAPKAIDLPKLVATLRSQLSSTRQPLKVAAVNSVYQLVQRDAALMSKIGGDGLVQELFALLDDDPSIEGVRDAITSWLRQTADVHPSGWIDLCQRIMLRSAGSNQPVEGAVAVSSFVDEESQGLGLETEGGARPGAAAARTTSRWRTQLFALQCLHEVFLTVAKSGRLEHFDIVRARAVRANRRGLLVTRVADLIKMAFTASTAQVMDIRLEGLVVLRDVIEVRPGAFFELVPRLLTHPRAHRTSASLKISTSKKLSSSNSTRPPSPPPSLPPLLPTRTPRSSRRLFRSAPSSLGRESSRRSRRWVVSSSS